MATASTAIVASGSIGADAAVAQTAAYRPPVPAARPLSPEVSWPATGEVERRDGNGLSIAGGIASVDGSDQYRLSSIRVNAERQSIEFSYVDAWTQGSGTPPSCGFTFRRVERVLTQEQANVLSETLATAGLDRLKADYPSLTPTDARFSEGAAVTRRVDRFTVRSGTGEAKGLSKTWVFVLDNKGYYVNKVCLAADSSALTVIDQLIGLNYRTGVTAPIPAPAPVPAPAPATPPDQSPAAMTEPQPVLAAVAPVVAPAQAQERTPGWRLPRMRFPRLRP